MISKHSIQLPSAQYFHRLASGNKFLVVSPLGAVLAHMQVTLFGLLSKRVPLTTLLLRRRLLLRLLTFLKLFAASFFVGRVTPQPRSKPQIKSVHIIAKLLLNAGLWPNGI
jgi:hypothetical protein